MKKNNHRAKRLSSEIVHKNPWYKIRKDVVVWSNGHRGEYFVIKNDTGKSSLVVALENDKIIFVRQYRYVRDDFSVELPGGGVDDGDTPLESARKELREEAGCISENFEEVGTFIPISGALDEITHVFVARDATFIGQQPEKTEDGIEIVKISIDEACAMIEDGRIIDGQTITALTLAKKYFK